MSDLQEMIREKAKSLLQSGEVKYFIGWGATRFPDRTTPKFITRAEDAEQLVFNEHCLNTLVKYALDDRYTEGKIGVVVRGCDSRAVNRLVKDGQAAREGFHLVGIPCPGMTEDGQEANKCRRCTHRNPVVYDELLGEAVDEREVPDRFSDVEDMEALSPDERYSYWKGQYDKCIRCYACRNVCPACNCVECYADQYRTGWQGKGGNGVENQVYGMTRAYHIGDRCIECGECERVCPMNLTLMKLNRKLVKDVGGLFGHDEAGLDPDQPRALGTFRLEDLEEFM